MQRIFNEHDNQIYRQVGDMLTDFCNKIKDDDRCLSKHRVFDLLQKIHEKNKIIDTYQKGDILFRARIINDFDFEDSHKVGKFPFEGYSKKESGAPPKNFARALRANYDGISYLYCSNSPYGAMAEVRPSLQSKISLSEIMLKDKVRLFSLDFERIRETALNEEVALILHLSSLFAKPIGVNDLCSDYYPTQRIANFIKSLKYDGITYSSAFDRTATNICIFSKDKCRAKTSRIYTLGNIVYDFLPNISKHEPLDIACEVSDIASRAYYSICGQPLPPEMPTIEKLEKVLKIIRGKDMP